MKVGFAIPGPIAGFISGGYIYDRALIEQAPKCGVELVPLELPGGFPKAAEDPVKLRQTERVLEEWSGPLLVDGLAYGVFPERLARKVGARTIALVHHPLAMETGLAEEAASQLYRSEKTALAHALGVITTSETTARTLVSDYGTPREKISVAPPGFERRPRALLGGEPPVILAVGALIRRKRFPELIGALRRLSDLSWRCALVGPVDADREESRRLEGALELSGVRERVDIVGAIGDEELQGRYACSDVFVSTAAYEGYGMAIAEAALHGLPIVASAGGAAAETASAGVLVDPALEGGEFEESFAQALRPLLSSASLRREVSDRVWAAREIIPTQLETASVVVETLKETFG